MADRLNLYTLRALHLLDFRRDTYIDAHGHESIMAWVPPFRAARALTAVAGVATPSQTVGDWLLPSRAPGTDGVDYELVDMGGYWVDDYLCSSPDASADDMGTVADGITVMAYVSQPGVAPRVAQTIVHFKEYLASRFSGGGFAGDTAGSRWAGKGGLITDQHWFELWVLTRIHRILLRGNTAGYDGTNPSIPVYHGDLSEIGVLDGSQPASYGASITGGGPKSWEVPVSDFCGNRWEFTDGLRWFDGGIYTAGKTINPPSSYADPAYTSTGLTITGVTSGQSIDSYRTEAALRPHGIPATTVTAGTGRMDGQGISFSAVGERVARRGGDPLAGPTAPGAMDFSVAPDGLGWYIGARAVLVP